MPSRTSLRPLRIGILGCANIARQFARDVAPSRHVKIIAVASRDATKAAAFAIARTHGSYEGLLADEQVDAIYNPLPNSLHAHWSIEAAKHRKHVLCEKPLALNRAEAQAMFDAARHHGVMLLEAYPYWFQPQTGDLLKLLHGGAIGTRALGAGQLRLQPAERQRQHPAEPRPGRRRAAGRRQLPAEPDPPGDGRRTAACAGRVAPGAQRRGHRHHRDAAVGRRPPGADGLRDGRGHPPPRQHRRHAGAVETEYLNHTAAATTGHPYGYQPSQMRVRRGIAGTVPIETLRSPVGSGFRFAAEAFARVVATQDQAAIDRAAQASLDIAAMLEAIALGARTGQAVDVTR
jgi:predicted dehydrogenase